jgi:hypothetical protein
MLVFIDESGDSGFKLNEGSSPYFVICLVVFEDREEADACEKRIELLKTEIGKGSDWEFHFKTNSHKLKEKFLRAVLPFNFFYYGIVLDKSLLYKEGFTTKDSFYKYTCGLVFENAKDKLDAATVIIDETGSLLFKSNLAKYLMRKMNESKNVIKRVRMENSHSSNLLQLADYIAGSINRSYSDKADGKVYRKIVSSREIDVRLWPK